MKRSNLTRRIVSGQRQRPRRGFPPLSAEPGFRESLRLLLEEEKYSMTDIGLMFGVSRERIRQLCERERLANPDGVKVGLNAYRVWDDGANRFRPVSRGQLGREARQEKAARTQSRIRERITARRARIIAAADRLRAELGRHPKDDEIWVALGNAPNRMAVSLLLGMWGHKRDSARGLREMRAATGDRPVMPLGRYHDESRRRSPKARLGKGEEL